MYGYIRFYRDELKIKDYELFKSYYCGLCRELKNQYGQRGRMLLSYDMTFMAIFLDSLKEIPPQKDRGFCPTSPFKKKPMIKNSQGIKKAAILTMLMGYYKLEDAWADDKNYGAKLAMSFYKKPFRKSKEANRDLANHAELKLKAFYQGEKENTQLDVLTDPFAALIGDVMAANAPKEQQKDFYKMGYHAGRWLYFIDALDDLPKDVKDKKFNAFTATLPYPRPTWQTFYEAAKDDIYANLFVSLDEVTKIFQQLPIKSNKELIENIFFLGIRGVTEVVLDYREHGKEETFATPFQIKTACTHDAAKDN